jgi:hypothetical protein
MDVTRYLQIEIKAIVDSLSIMKEEVADIGKVYWSTDANTALSALAAGDAATLSTKLTKSEMVSGITLCEQLDKFFTNQALAASDYGSTCQNLVYGNDARTAKLSESVEALGTRMVQVARDCLVIFKKCTELLSVYSANQVNLMITSLDTDRTIPGSDMTKDELSSGMVLLEQFKKLINNETATQGDYASTLAQWKRL